MEILERDATINIGGPLLNTTNLLYEYHLSAVQVIDIRVGWTGSLATRFVDTGKTFVRGGSTMLYGVVYALVCRTSFVQSFIVSDYGTPD